MTNKKINYSIPMKKEDAIALNNDWQPVNDYIKLIRSKDKEVRSESIEKMRDIGLVVPDDMKEKASRARQTGIIISIGPGCQSAVSEGMHVSYPVHGARLCDEGTKGDEDYEYIEIRECDICQINMTNELFTRLKQEVFDNGSNR